VKPNNLPGSRSSLPAQKHGGFQAFTIYNIYRESSLDGVFAVMVMMTNHMKIRHVFGFTFLLEKIYVHSSSLSLAQCWGRVCKVDG
jgi:hypothetical protein